MDEYESLSHTKWECKYHVIFIPKYRRKALYGQLRAHLGEVFRRLAVQRESRIEEGHLMSDHVTQSAAAWVLGLSQLKVSALLNGQFQGYSQERLIEILIRLGCDVKIVVTPTPRSRAMGRVSVAFA
jgi:putative transposase